MGATQAPGSAPTIIDHDDRRLYVSSLVCKDCGAVYLFPAYGSNKRCNNCIFEEEEWRSYRSG